MDEQSRNAFLLLVVLQAVHASEEYATRLYEWGFPAMVSSLVYPPQPRLGFAVVNAGFIVFGLWCYLARVRPRHPTAIGWVSIWVIVELINGLLHPLLALSRGGYFPGVFTAPLLLAVAIFLANRLSRAPSGKALHTEAATPPRPGG